MSRGALALALGALAFSSCTCTEIAGPEAQLRQLALGLEKLQALPEAGIRIQRLEVSRITPEPELARPRVTFTFDLEGTVPVRGQPVRVSALGVARPFVAESGGYWRVDGPVLPRLEAVVSALARDAEAAPSAPLPDGWAIRVDQQVEVSATRGGRTVDVLRPAPLPDGGFAVRPSHDLAPAAR